MCYQFLSKNIGYSLTFETSHFLNGSIHHRKLVSGGGGWVSILPFQNTIRIQVRVFVPESGLYFGPIRCMHLWVTKSSALTTEVPVNMAFTSLVLDSSHIWWWICQEWNHINSHFFNILSVLLWLHLASTILTVRTHTHTHTHLYKRRGTPLWHTSSGVSFGNSSRSCCWLALAQHPTEA